jgi:surface polysaccharide O-acyltransferase-like enzyme
MKAVHYGEIELSLNARTSVRSLNLVWIDNARILAAIAVVLGHSVFRVAMHAPGPDTAVWWTSNLYLSVAWWCVPVFIMVSGMLLLNPHKERTNTGLL